MKRSPLKRTKGLERRTPLERGAPPLQADPEATRAFVQRGRESGARALQGSARRGRAREVAARATEGPLRPHAWRVEVFRRAGGVCSVSGTRARDEDDEGFHGHHAVPAAELRRRGLREFVWHPDNGVWLSAEVHMNHEGGTRRVPRHALPEAVWLFAARLDDLDGTSWATVMVERLHPE